ncbi:histidinol-phosphate transaminase [Paenibacillus sp. PsM32]|uniref:Histidinol-phosphate aminotransferase n=1 Tax=Paenibacillus kyungheensis TaxID=1452732 RepID=A0AAX3LYB1_9BACL|nr:MULTISPECIES: histidinol-phosphate transaminase [Paenibacillus]MDN4618005.1 histidinol-phosphate transaminase [Paenibacillus sp. PsM32]MDQ1234726.1 histidinol-phosphate aminotransferase [Paenibacillus sp. SORGH_AS_0306]MDR6111771.1 histidinol-phosphate aminotransferase [Paenibacillus sp. SORGH_AS_0338]WCT54321.1 histidinol-phosphate transaminase [Paenibacillus kyungheensis]
MKPKSRIVNIPVYQPGKPLEEVKRELGLSEVIKLASNENPYGSAPSVQEAIAKELTQLHIYPDGGAVELTAQLGAHLGVEPNQIIFGCGSDEIIALITRAFLEPGDETIMADQTFSVYKSNADIEGALVHEVPLKDGVHDLEGMMAQVNGRTKIIWVCNPNNPTGTIVSHEELIGFLEQVPSSVMVVLDEAYYEYVTDAAYPQSLKLLEKYTNVVILRTFSKIYGLAALRIGYGVGHADVIKLINQVREPFNTSRIGQAAARQALADQHFVQECHDKNKEGIQYLTAEFDRLGLHYFPSQTNFIMVDVKHQALEIFQSMLRRGVIVRAGHQKYPTYIRVTVGTARENEIFIRALEESMQEQSTTV